LIKADHTSILLEKERLICSSSLLEKKKISAERRLIAAEKTISGHEKTILGYENKIAETENKIAETENKTAESENLLIYLLEKLQLREEDIDEGGMERK
jgi:uncharacterized coiled-coil protein SlyX